MKALVVSDTNIFIDLVKLGILGDFFNLPWEIHTTDFVLDELTDTEQYKSVAAFLERGKLMVGKFTAEDVSMIMSISESAKGNISPTDYSVLLYASQKSAKLLSGDGRLRKEAEKIGVEVHGILYVIESLVAETILPEQFAAKLLADLKNINKRLPIEEIDAMIKQLINNDNDM